MLKKYNCCRENVSVRLVSAIKHMNDSLSIVNCKKILLFQMKNVSFRLALVVEKCDC